MKKVLDDELLTEFKCEMHGQRYKSKDLLMKHFLCRKNNHFVAVAKLLEQNPGILSLTYMKLAAKLPGITINFEKESIAREKKIKERKANAAAIQTSSESEEEK